MKKKTTTLAAITLTLGLLGACGERNDAWNKRLQIDGPHVAGGQALWLDGTRGLTFSLDPVGLGVTVAALPRNIAYARATADGEQLLVLTRGREAERRDQTSEDPQLSLLAPRKGAKVLRSYPLPAAFDRVAVSDDGKYALTYFAPTSGAAPPSGVFRNPNQLAIIDLSQPSGTANPIVRTVRSFGSSPLAALLSPPMALGAGQQTRAVAVLLSRGYVTLLDLQNPTRREITVRLTVSETTEVVPEQTLFAASEGVIYVRASGAADIYGLALSPTAASGDDANDFSVRINQPSAGQTVRDALLYQEGTASRLLTVTTSGDLAVIDAGSSEAVLVPLGEPVDRLLGVPHDQPTRALAWAKGGKRVLVIELAQLETKGKSNIVARTLAKSVRELVATPSGAQALVLHDDNRTVASLLDLEGIHHTDTPLVGQLALESFAFVGDRHLVGVSSGLARLGIVELEGVQPRALNLDYGAKRVLAIGNRILIDHDSPLGLVTLVPSIGAGRDETRVLWGFLLDNLLERPLAD